MAMYPMAKVTLRHFPTLQPKISMYLTVAAKRQGHCGSEPYNPVASNNACSFPRGKKSAGITVLYAGNHHVSTGARKTLAQPHSCISAAKLKMKFYCN